jgi:hypothetical protein
MRARGREGRAGKLLGVQTIGDLLGRIAVLRQGAGQGFGGEFVAESAHVSVRQGYLLMVRGFFVTVDEKNGFYEVNIKM